MIHREDNDLMPPVLEQLLRGEEAGLSSTKEMVELVNHEYFEGLFTGYCHFTETNTSIL